MVRATRKSLKFFSYAVALIAGAILVVFGIQAKNEGGTVVSDQGNLIVDEAQAAHIGGDAVFQGDDGGGDDDDGGGGDGGGG